MTKPVGVEMRVETQPDLEELRLLEDRLYEFNVQATGISDGAYLAVFLRDEAGVAIGGIFGWTWGASCYIRSLYVPAHLRHLGLVSTLLQLVENEAKTRGCTQIVLETHEFQAPDFYRRFGFETVGQVDDYPHGHQLLAMRKRLSS